MVTNGSISTASARSELIEWYPEGGWDVSGLVDKTGVVQALHFAGTIHHRASNVPYHGMSGTALPPTVVDLPGRGDVTIDNCLSTKMLSHYYYLLYFFSSMVVRPRYLYPMDLGSHKEVFGDMRPGCPLLHAVNDDGLHPFLGLNEGIQAFGPKFYDPSHELIRAGHFVKLRKAMQAKSASRCETMGIPDVGVSFQQLSTASVPLLQ
jgi:hypothetical protein